MNPQSLLSRILQAKYFPNNNILTHNLSCNAFSAWKGIWKAGLGIKKWITYVQNHCPVWLGDLSGNFYVKSVYCKLKHEHDQRISSLTGECSDNDKLISFWKTLWRVRVQSKVKYFLWRLYHKFLPVGINFRKRGCDAFAKCWFCELPEESSTHVFWNCWWAHAFWYSLGLGRIVYKETFQNMAD